MSTVNIADVKRLREETGAGMMDCKKALEETEGDFDAAVELLRVKGAAKAAKRGAERIASNGIVVAHESALVEINCETDFVAKNEQFQALGSELATLANDVRATNADDLLAAKGPDGRTASEAIEGLAAVIGEKLAIGQVAAFDGKTTVYLHRKATDLPPQLGVLVAYEGADDSAARVVAMQIAAMRPAYVKREDVPTDILDAKKEEFAETARGEGKPDKIIPRIVDGRLNAFYKGAGGVLGEQLSIRDEDNDKTVGQVLAEAGLTVTKFACFDASES